MRFAFVLLAMVAGSASAEPLHWYVVLGSFSVENDGDQAAAILREKVARCGIGASTEYTIKMRGLRPGYVATFTGPFPDKRAAERNLAFVKTCVPDAYIKQAEEGGE
jgi:hypothetical protein